MTGAELIAAERQRQIEQEGWSPEHDRGHTDGELRDAALAYLADDPSVWPWGPQWWKPTPDDPIRQLVKAGALIAAEIDALSPRDPSGKPKEEA